MVCILTNRIESRAKTLEVFEIPVALSNYALAAQRADAHHFKEITLQVEDVASATKNNTDYKGFCGDAEFLVTCNRRERPTGIKSLCTISSSRVEAFMQPIRLPVSTDLEIKVLDLLLDFNKSSKLDEVAFRKASNSICLPVPLVEKLSPKSITLHHFLKQLEDFNKPIASFPNMDNEKFKAPDVQSSLLPAPSIELVPWKLEKHILTRLNDRQKLVKTLEKPVCVSVSFGRAEQLTQLWKLLSKEFDGMFAEGPSSSERVSDLRTIITDRSELAVSLQPYQLPPTTTGSALGIHTLLKSLRNKKMDAFIKPRCDMKLLEMPVLLMKGWNEPMTMETCFPELFAPLPEPDFKTDWEEIYGKPGVTIDSLVAHDLLLDDDSCMLPAIIIDGTADGITTSSSSFGCFLRQLQAECKIAPGNSTHAAIYLDWSLITRNAALRPQPLLSAAKQLQTGISAKRLPVPPRQENFQLGAKLLQLLVDAYGCYQSTNKQACKVDLAAPCASKLQMKACPVLHKHRAAASQSDTTSLQMRQGNAGQGLLNLKAGYQSLDVSSTSAAPPAVKPPSIQGELQYFLKLQQGSAPARLNFAKHGQEQSSDSAADNIEDFLCSAARSITQVQLSDTHLQILRYLKVDEWRLVMSTPGISPAVASSDFFSLDLLHDELQRLAGQHPPHNDMVRVCAAMAVIRQTAICVVHHGVRCAHLYLKQSGTELPGLLNGVTASQELQLAYRQVESNSMEDHPKQSALRRILGSTDTMSPGGKVLILADSKSFFTLYHAIMTAGYKVCQFDRLIQAGTSKDKIAAAVAQSLQNYNCVLASVQHAISEQVPVSCFQHVIQYASEPENYTALEPFLNSCNCPQYIMHVVLQSLEAPSQIPSTIGLASIPASQPLQAEGSGQGRSGSLAHDWPVVVSSDPERPIRQQRLLYEGVVRLEKDGAAVIERHLALIDAILSPSAAMIIFDNTKQCLEFVDFLEAMQPVMERTSYAFCKIVLICQGLGAFQAQILCGMGQLLAIGLSYGLQLQVLTSTSCEFTKILMSSVCSAFLMKWRDMDAKLHYTMSDSPSQQELFLSRFPSINPHSAAVLCGTGLSIQQLLQLDLSKPETLPASLSMLPKQSLLLFMKCAKYGQPVLGIARPRMHPQIESQSGPDLVPATATGVMQKEMAQHATSYERQNPVLTEFSELPQLQKANCSTQLPGSAKKQRVAGIGLAPPIYQGTGAGNTRPTQQVQYQHAIQRGTGCLPHGMEQNAVDQTPLHDYSSRLRAKNGIARLQGPGLLAPDSSKWAAQQPLIAPPGSRLDVLDSSEIMNRGDYLTAQLIGHQAADARATRSLPGSVMDDMVYQRSMQMMHARMGARPNLASGRLPRDPTGPLPLLVDMEAIPNFDPGFINPGIAHPLQPGALSPVPALGLSSELKNKHHLMGSRGLGMEQGMQGQNPGWDSQGAWQQRVLQVTPHQVRNGMHQPMNTAQRAYQHQDGQQQQQRQQQHFAMHGQLHSPQMQPPGSQYCPPLFGHHPIQHLSQPQNACPYPEMPPNHWQGTVQQQQQHPQQNSYDEFGVSLEPSISESDHDDTMAAQLSPLGLGREHQLQAVMDPISALVSSRPEGFAAPRLTPPTQLRRGAGRNPSCMEDDGQPPTKKRRGAFATSARRTNSQNVGGQKKYGRGYAASKNRGVYPKGTVAGLRRSYGGRK